MTINEYQQEALRTANGKDDHHFGLLTNGVMGLCGESGECMDIVKKCLFQGHLLDGEHLIEELGDVAWYLAITAAAAGYTLNDVLQKNVEKLRKRYPDGFSADRSIHREETE